MPLVCWSSFLSSREDGLVFCTRRRRRECRGEERPKIRDCDRLRRGGESINRRGCLVDRVWQKRKKEKGGPRRSPAPCAQNRWHLLVSTLRGARGRLRTLVQVKWATYSVSSALRPSPPSCVQVTVTSDNSPRVTQVKGGGSGLGSFDPPV